MEAEEGIRRVVWLPRELDRQIEEIAKKSVTAAAEYTATYSQDSLKKQS